MRWLGVANGNQIGNLGHFESHVFNVTPAVIIFRLIFHRRLQIFEERLVKESHDAPNIHYWGRNGKSFAAVGRLGSPLESMRQRDKQSSHADDRGDSD